jgi:hypothetical protein
MKLRGITFIASCLMAFALHAGAQNSTVFDDAIKELGGLSTGVRTNIDTPEQYVPRYNTDQSGNGELYGEGELVPIDPGNAKVSGCANDPANPNLYNRQECEGINFVTKNRTIRPKMTVTTKDPIISGNRVITSDPRETLEKYKWLVPVNADGSVGTVPSNACSATSVVTQTVIEERRCTFYKGSENFLCKAPLKVTVVPQFNFQCQDTLGVNQTEKCSKILKVSCYQVCPPITSSVKPYFTSFQQSKGASVSVSGPNNDRISVATYNWGGAPGGGAIFIKLLDRNKLEYIKVIGQNANPNCGPSNQRDSTENYVRTGSSRGPCFFNNQDFKHLLANGNNEVYVNTDNQARKPVVVEYREVDDPTACPPPTCNSYWDNQCQGLEERAR